MIYFIIYQGVNFNFRFVLKLECVVCCEIYPSAALKVKSLAQRTLVRFRHHFTFALQRNKFLGEKSGLNRLIKYLYFPSSPAEEPEIVQSPLFITTSSGFSTVLPFNSYVILIPAYEL